MRKETIVSVASRSHEEDRALFSTFVVPRFDAHLVQPQPFTTEDAYWQLILARLETRHALQQLRAQQATLLTTARSHDAQAALATLHTHQSALDTQDAQKIVGFTWGAAG
jgi:hypothetical protein